MPLFRALVQRILVPRTQHPHGAIPDIRRQHHRLALIAVMQQRATGRRRAGDLILAARLGDLLRLLERALQVGDHVEVGQARVLFLRHRAPHAQLPEVRDQPAPQRGVAALLLRPLAHAVVAAEEVLAADHDRVVAVRDALDQLAVHAGVAGAGARVVGQRVGEGAGREGEEGRREGARGPLGEDAVGRVEEVRAARERLEGGRAGLVLVEAGGRGGAALGDVMALVRAEFMLRAVEGTVVVLDAGDNDGARPSRREASGRHARLCGERARVNAHQHIVLLVEEEEEMGRMYGQGREEMLTK